MDELTSSLGPIRSMKLPEHQHLFQYQSDRCHHACRPEPIAAGLAYTSHRFCPLHRLAELTNE